MSNIVEKALNFAIAKHGNQKYGTHPYSYHLEGVVRNCEEYLFMCPDDIEFCKVVAALHDVLEDTDTTAEELVENFGEDVANAVAHITHLETDDYYDDYIPRIKSNMYSLLVKKCDLLFNLSECYKNPEKYKNLIDKYSRVFIQL